MKPVDLKKIIRHILILLMLCPAVANAAISKENQILLMKLDSLIARMPELRKTKEARIKAQHDKYLKSTDSEQKYWAAVALFDEYGSYDSDSALYYVDSALDLAKIMGRRDLEIEMTYDKSYVKAATGMFDESQELLSKFDVNALTTSQFHKYCNEMLFLASHRDIYLGEDGRPAYPANIDTLIQKALPTLKPTDRYYGWIRGWNALQLQKNPEGAIKDIKKVVDSSEFNSREDALNAWMLAHLYEIDGNFDMALRYLIKSSMADLNTSIREMASLQEIAQLLVKEKDYARANEYVNVCMNAAYAYKSRIRMSELAALQRTTMGELNAQLQKRADDNRRMTIILSITLLILLFGTVYIVRQMQIIKKSKGQLNDANEELSRRINELQKTREDLDEANEKLHRMYSGARQSASQLAVNNDALERQIASVFLICSNYINKLDNFRIKISKMIAERKFEDLARAAKNQELSQAEIKELYTAFDSIFLQMYPNFPQEFNNLMRPDERTELKKAGTLNTELRIYALVRLGLNDSVKIASFLHVSVQTVYNTRQRARNKALIPGNEFAAAVQNLGKVPFQ